jgi:hypothetical protein
MIDDVVCHSHWAVSVDDSLQVDGASPLDLSRTTAMKVTYTTQKAAKPIRLSNRGRSFHGKWYQEVLSDKQRACKHADILVNTVERWNQRAIHGGIKIKTPFKKEILSQPLKKSS